MKLVIEIDKVAYNLLTGKIETANIDLYSILIQSVQNGTPLPDNATNGDMIKTIFPETKIYDDVYVMHIGIGRTDMNFSKDWWNAPYKKGENK